MKIEQKKHELGAKLLRYAGYNAKCVKNQSFKQPFEIHVKGIGSDEAKVLQTKISDLLKHPSINVIEA